MSSHSADNKGSDHGTFIYALQFLNPFDSQNQGSMNSDMVVKDARLGFMRIYKTSDDNPEKQVIPQLAEDSISWLKDGLSAEQLEGKIKKSEYHIAVLSSVFYSLKEELGLHYSLLQSRDKDEVFCKIFVSEDWMHRNSKANEYELQFKSKENYKEHNFKEVPPYAPANLMDYKDKTGELTYGMKFKKYDHDGKENDAGHTIFTSTDKRRLVMNVIGQRIDLHALKGSGVMAEDFCVHEAAPLEDLKSRWANFSSFCKSQPLDDIKTYFAEKVALYFAWIDVYWRFMMICATVGLITFTAFTVIKYTSENPANSAEMIGFQIFYAVFLAFWASSFEQIWTRQENKLAWRWGTKNLDVKEIQRPEFKGIFDKDEISGKMKVLEDPNEKRFLKSFVSFLVIFFFMCIVAVSVSMIFYLRYVLKAKGYSKLGKTIPAFLNALQIRILNLIYGKVVVILNNWENHETENQQNDNLALKNFLFKFVNSYFSLFYMAFFKVYFESTWKCSDKTFKADECPAGQLYEVPGCDDCMYDLGYLLLIIFITNMCMNVMELGLPWLKWRVRIAKENAKVERAFAGDSTYRKELYPVEYDSKLEPYETPADDYMEMIIQFGYVALFGVSNPIIAVLAFLEITLEIRVDAWKICHLTKRPDPHRSNSLGVWKPIIVTVAYVGSITNSAIIVFTSKLFTEYSMSDKMILFIVIEHALLGVMYLVSSYVNDVPTQVSNGLVWSKRKIDGKFLSWKTEEDAQAEYTSSKGGEAFFIQQSDFHHH